MSDQFITIEYYNNGKHICGNDLEKIKGKTKINIQYILSLSELLEFVLPFSGNYVGSYAELVMSNKDMYYINEKSLIEINKTLK